MIVKKLISIFFIVFSLNVVSQNISFKGKVFNENDLPEKNITITIEGTDFTTKTDNDGFFEFNENIPLGKNIVTATGIGFKIKYFTIDVSPNKNIFVQKIKMKFTKDEKRRRWILAKVRKEEERRMQRERKKIVGKLKKSTTVPSSDNSLETNSKTTNTLNQAEKIEKPIVYGDDVSEIQIKFSKKLGVPVDDIFNEELYEYIDQWLGVPYIKGGTSKNGIDDLNFVKKVLENVFDLKLESTLDKVFNSKLTETFTDLNVLNEGDLVFFNGYGSKSHQIVHIGIYLTGNKFIHAIEQRKSGQNGVVIDDLTNPFWKVRISAGGRRLYSE